VPASSRNVLLAISSNLIDTNDKFAFFYTRPPTDLTMNLGQIEGRRQDAVPQTLGNSRGASRTLSPIRLLNIAAHLPLTPGTCL
jgi:hypothetical protein